jgi:stage II sporulation protein D
MNKFVHAQIKLTYRNGSEHHMLRAIVFVVAILLIMILVIPATVVYLLPSTGGQILENPIPEEHASLQLPDKIPSINVSVYRTGSKQTESVPLEKYVRGVIASEMPAEFEIEALKAQALAARTYIVRRLVEKEFTDTPKGSEVTDTELHQVYLNEEELRQRWGYEYDRKITRINQAVNETLGQVLTYDGKPINATFFSTSNGFTENSEEYWGAELPYLRSVKSPWDSISPRYHEQLEVPFQDFQKKLKVQLNVPSSTGVSSEFSEIISRTAGNRVKEVKVGERIFTGKEIRELLGLSSSHFDWTINNGKVVIKTLGWGHGVGMSQWGANGMAMEGYKAEDIVKHYYQGIQIQDFRQWIVKK